MGWDRGYYYRTKRVNGRVVRQYVGAGRVAELAAELDAVEREKRRLDALDLRQQKADMAALDADLDTLCKLTDLAARAALLAAGYRRHHRGEWRKRRENSENPRGG
jgi:hypothetical protein